jgi:hypothetical protein
MRILVCEDGFSLCLLCGRSMFSCSDVMSFAICRPTRSDFDRFVVQICKFLVAPSAHDGEITGVDRIVTRAASCRCICRRAPKGENSYGGGNACRSTTSHRGPKSHGGPKENAAMTTQTLTSTN